MMNERIRIKKNKLRTFTKFKLTHDYENYLTKVRNISHRVAITKLRSTTTNKQLKLGDTLNPINHQIKESVHYEKLEQKTRSIFW